MGLVKSNRTGAVGLIEEAISSQTFRAVPVGEKYINPTVGFWVNSMFISVTSVLFVLNAVVSFASLRVMKTSPTFPLFVLKGTLTKVSKI